MSLFRKVIVIALLGLLLGSAAGAGFAYWRRVTRGSVVTTESPDGTLFLSCFGGTSPKIRVTWPVKLTSEMDGLERSIDGGAWQKVFTSGSEPLAAGYLDTTVTPDREYSYRIRLTEKGPFTSAHIQTDQTTCQ